MQRVDQVGAAVFGRERPVGVQPAQQRRAHPAIPRATWASACSKTSRCSSAIGAAGRHRMAAEAQQHAGMALGHQVERIAQVKAGDRAARAFEFVLLARRLAGREHEGRAVQLVLDARGDDADHAFVEVGVEHADRGRRLLALVEQRVDHQHRLLAHAAFDVAALAVDARRAARASSSARAGSSVSRHSMPSVMSASRPAALMRGPSAKPKSKRGRRLRRRAPRPRTARRARSGMRAGADALQALRDQAAVVGVELDDVGDGAQRDQVEQRVELAAALAWRRTRRAARSSARSASST